MESIIMSTPVLPPASFRWLLDVFSVGISARLIKECRAVVEMITAIQPGFEGEDGLEGLLLMKEQRLSEAIEHLTAARNRHPALTLPTYFLYQCLRSTDNPEWIFYAQEVARDGPPEFAAAAREALGTQLAGGDASPAGDAAHETPPFGSGPHMLMRI
jgi:Bacterial type III secretion protein (HrpB1_HrpK)